jgi:hypothetical protein
MSEATERFQEAFRRHLAAKAAAKKKIEFIEAAIGSIRRYPHSFLGMQGLASLPPEGSGGGRYQSSARHTMEEWPTADGLQKILKEWGESWLALRDASNGVPESEQIGLAKMPENLSLD